jgi:hypothetical protein
VHNFVITREIPAIRSAEVVISVSTLIGLQPAMRDTVADCPDILRLAGPTEIPGERLAAFDTQQRGLAARHRGYPAATGLI